MDIEFLIQDTYSLTRPQWTIASDLQEAARLFSEAVAQNYNLQDVDKAEPEEDDAESITSNEGLEEDAIPDVDEDGQSSAEEAEVSFLNMKPAR